MSISETIYPLLSTDSKIVCEYDQEIPQSKTADNPMAPRGRTTQPVKTSPGTTEKMLTGT